MPDSDVVQAVGALIQADPARIVAIAASLRAPDRTLESTVEGVSMGGGLPPGSRIRIALVERARYDAGEVIAYLAGNQVIVHRVAHRGRFGAAAGLVLARGDTPLVPDPPLKHVQILGPVNGVWREGRWDELTGAPRRPFSRHAAAAFLLLMAIGLLYISPRLATAMLTLLNRAEAALRSARVRRLRLREPVPPGTA